MTWSRSDVGMRVGRTRADGQQQRGQKGQHPTRQGPSQHALRRVRHYIYPRFASTLRDMDIPPGGGSSPLGKIHAVVVLFLHLYSSVTVR